MEQAQAAAGEGAAHENKEMGQRREENLSRIKWWMCLNEFALCKKRGKRQEGLGDSMIAREHEHTRAQFN